MGPGGDIRVWRYMSFAKLVWMLQKKQLWLTRADLLGDKWEVTLHSHQANTVMTRRPTQYTVEEVRERASRIVRNLRRTTFVNCWTASEHESHALWKIYCPSEEGVAIQTTLTRLMESVRPLKVVHVTYGEHGADGTTPDVKSLVAQKRPMYEYEQEVRVVLVKDFGEDDDRITIGAGINWDPAVHLENIWVHPEAPFWFMEAVTEAVRQLAPDLSDDGVPRVPWSKLNASPPF